MTYYTSKLSSKGQVTIPVDIRDQLRLSSGDTVLYAVDEETVTLRRAEPFDAAYHAALSDTLDEWNSPEDDEAFRDL